MDLSRKADPGGGRSGFQEFPPQQFPANTNPGFPGNDQGEVQSWERFPGAKLLEKFQGMGLAGGGELIPEKLE